MCGFTFTVFLSLFQLLPTAPYRILELGGDKFAAGLFLGFLTYASALSAPFAGALVDRVGGLSVLALSLVMAAIAFSMEDSRGPAEAAKEGSPVRRRLVDIIEWRVFVVSMSLFLCSFGYGGVTSFVALYAEKNHIEPRSLYFTVFSVVVLLTRPFSGRLADRVGYKRVFVPCLVFVVLAFGLLAVSTTRGRMTASAVLFGIGFGNLYPVCVAHVMRHIDAVRRGAAFGGILGAFDTGIGTGSIVLGWVIERFGFSMAYGFATGLAALSIPTFLLLDRWVLSGVETIPETAPATGPP